MTDPSPLGDLQSENATLRDALGAALYREGAFPAGHYYSPIPDRFEVTRLTASERVFPRELPGIQINAQDQLKLLSSFEPFSRELPFPVHADASNRYYYENSFFSYGDAIALYSMIRRTEPARVVEVGSGFSSAIMLEVNERFFAGNISCTFIEPHPDRLYSLLRSSDRDASTIVERTVQECDPSLFRELKRNDILFIDSSHVLKYGGDLAYLFAEVLPILTAGVVVHFHDIFYPFEYPAAWLNEGRFWNECYFVRAFLTHNSAYRIELFNDYLRIFHREALGSVTPLWLNNTGGSLWLRKIA